MAGCSAAAIPHATSPADFFPLAPNSRWEYVVSRRTGSERFRFVATVRQDEFLAADGRACRIVDERYADLSAGQRFPVVYCAEGGFLHRVMSLEYRGDSLEDNGLRSGEVKFLPTDLSHAHAWEGRTNAYRLPDGSGFIVQQFHEAVPERGPIVVPAGQFARCVRVDTTAIHSATAADGEPVGPRVTFYYSDWYAPEIGLVKTEQRSTDAQVLATIELVEYEIGGKAR
jgi:hypothetical protein